MRTAMTASALRLVAAIGQVFAVAGGWKTVELDEV
jgi:hypothetical protein